MVPDHSDRYAISAKKRHFRDFATLGGVLLLLPHCSRQLCGFALRFAQCYSAYLRYLTPKIQGASAMAHTELLKIGTFHFPAGEGGSHDTCTATYHCP